MMDGFQFRYAQYLYLLLLLPPLGLGLHLLIERRLAAINRFLGGRYAVSHYRWRAGLLLGVLCCLTLALARPQWGQSEELVQTRGVDVVIAVDVSLSMLADDELPSRLDRARRLAADLIERLGSNRVGLIAFAGSSAGLMPLTLDTAALRSFVDELNVRVVDTPGTSISNAIARAVKSLKEVGRSSRALIIISDGEDQDDAPQQAVARAAGEAAEHGIAIITVGVGTEHGSTIPLDAVDSLGVKRDADGNVVTTKLEEATLKAAAETTGGIYLRADPQGGEVERIVAFIDRMEKGELEGRVKRNLRDRYQYPLALALGLLLVELALQSSVKIHSLSYRALSRKPETD